MDINSPSPINRCVILPPAFNIQYHIQSRIFSTLHAGFFDVCIYTYWQETWFNLNSIFFTSSISTFVLFVNLFRLTCEKRYLYFELQNSILFDFRTIDYFTNNIENIEYFFFFEQGFPFSRISISKQSADNHVAITIG